MQNPLKVNLQKTALDILLNGEKTKKSKSTFLKSTSVYKRDKLTISNEAVQLQQASQQVKQSKNTSLDQTIDIQSYFERALEQNAAAIENADDVITSSPQKHAQYVDYYDVYRQILTDKYTALVEIAKQHSNPEQYIEQKYFDKTCSWYAYDLTDEERSIAYRNEISVLNKGTTANFSYRDSFFRINNVAVPLEVEESAELSFKRQMLNAEIANIFKNNNIEIADDETYELLVDPYSYYITVLGVDEEKKYHMEQALNTGDNGKNLWQHIYWCSTRDGANSSQFDKLSYRKYQVFQNVYKYTGYQLNELKAENGTYYTPDGEDLKDLIQTAVRKSSDVPAEFKEGVIESIWDQITELYQYGWDNIPDMSLSISGNSLGLYDINQNISFGIGSSYVNKFLNTYQYSLLEKF